MNRINKLPGTKLNLVITRLQKREAKKTGKPFLTFNTLFYIENGGLEHPLVYLRSWICGNGFLSLLNGRSKLADLCEPMVRLVYDELDTNILRQPRYRGVELDVDFQTACRNILLYRDSAERIVRKEQECNPISPVTEPGSTADTDTEPPFDLVP